MHHAVRIGLGMAVLAAAVNAAFAEDLDAAAKTRKDATNLQGVAVSADLDDPNLAPAGTAAALPTMQGNLFEMEPQSVLSRKFIQTIATPKADYLAVMELTPSAVNASPNGAGLSSKSATVRGFQDGEYDVTFDGIPFGDPGAFGHATTAFFPGPSLDKVVVDRGPGMASNFGNATFGGTIALYSAPTTDQPSGQVSAMYGSGATWQVAGEGNTGTMNKIGTQASVNYSHTESDGLLQDANFRQDNVLFKVKQPLGDGNTTLTLVADYNKVKWNTFTGQPKRQTDRFGLDFGGLNDDPLSQGFYGYNIDDRHADFEYLQLHGDYGSIRFDNKFYTYGLRDSGPGGVDLLGKTPNAALLPGGGVPGAINHSRYRAAGDMLTAEKDLGDGWLDSTLRAGIWAERTSQNQDQVTVDLSTMDPRVFAGTPSANIITTRQHTNTTQSFLEWEWRPVEDLTVTPGVKQIVFDRELEGVSNFLPVGGAGHFSTTLGSIGANYRIQPNLSVYLQVAKGFQAPKVNILQGGDQGNVEPQKTTNYQAGVVWKTPSMVADLDVYYIDFNNLVTSIEEPIGPGGSLISVFTNQGGVIYKGVEGEFTRMLGESGLSFTANGSINSAYSKTTHLQIPNAPMSTADVGFIYDKGRLYGSFLVKYVGTRFTGTGETAGATYNPNTRLPKYNYTNFNIGYRIAPDLRVQLSTNNLFDHRTAIQGNGAATDPTYYYLAERNYTAQITYTF